VTFAADHPPTAPAGPTIGLILAGGLGRRMGGRDKAWLDLHGRPLLCHALERLSPQVDSIVVSANRHRWACHRLGLATIADRPAWRGRGPLAAIATALADLSPGRLALVPVDVPDPPRHQVALLASALHAGVPAAALRTGDGRQPLFALLDGSLAERAAAALDGPDVPSVQAWLDAVGVAWIDLPGTGGLGNINVPADLERARNAARPQ
jgi:molybdopterin-guanine dinucleotide biosynthesis protein A